MPRYRFAITDRFRAQGLDNAYKVGKALSKQPAAASRLFDPARTQINIETINELCEFFGCEPGDLFAREEKSAKTPRRKR